MKRDRQVALSALMLTAVRAIASEGGKPQDAIAMFADALRVVMADSVRNAFDRIAGGR